MEKQSELIDLITAVHYHITDRYEKIYGLEHNPSATAFFATGQCWYLAKMLKYLFPAVTIMEYRKGSFNLHYFIKYEDLYINSLGYEKDPEKIPFISELEPEHYPMVELGMEVDKGRLAPVYEAMSIDLVEYILKNPYYQEKLGSIRTEGLFYNELKTNHVFSAL